MYVCVCVCVCCTGENSPHDFVNPYQLEAEDEDDDDDTSLPDSQRIDFTCSTRSRNGSPLDRSASPIPAFLSQLKAVAGKSVDADAPPGERGSPLQLDSDNTRSSPLDEEGSVEGRRGGRFRSGSGLSRRSAITKNNKDRLMSSRDRARSRSHSGTRVPGPRVSNSRSLDDNHVTPTPPGEAEHARTASIPGIKIRKASTQVTPGPQLAQSVPIQRHHIPIATTTGLTHTPTTSHTITSPAPLATTSPDDSEPESNRSYVIPQQMHNSDSDTIPVVTDDEALLNSIAGGKVDVEMSLSPSLLRRHLNSNNNRRSGGGSPSITPPQHHHRSRSTSPEPTPTQRPVPRPRKTTPAPQDDGAVHATPFLDEFRKVQTLPQDKSDSFTKKTSPISSPASLPRALTPERKQEVRPVISSKDKDLFRKVGAPPSKPPAVWKGGEGRGQGSEEFKKVGVAVSTKPQPSSSELKTQPSSKEQEVKERVEREMVVPVMTTPLFSPPTHPPPSKPSVPARKRVLPTTPPEDHPPPTSTTSISHSGQPEAKPLHSRKTISDIGKQPSTTSSIISETSTTSEPSHHSSSAAAAAAAADSTSISSSGSGDSHPSRHSLELGVEDPHSNPPPPHVQPLSPLPSTLPPPPEQQPPSLPTTTTTSPTSTTAAADTRLSSRGFSRRNATRVSRNKRPPPQLGQTTGEDNSVENPGPQDADDKNDDDDLNQPRFRTRSGAVRNSGAGRPQRGLRGTAAGRGGTEGKHHLNTFEEEGEDEREERLGSRSRGSTVNSRDRGLARKARTAAVASNREGQGQLTTPTFKTDGEN